MHSYRVHSKATEISRNSPDFLKYMLWERKQYGFQEERGAFFLTKEEAARQLAPCYKAIDGLRGRLRMADRGPATTKRQETYDSLYRQIDAIQGQISLILKREMPVHLVPKAKASAAPEAAGKPAMKALTMQDFPAQVEERIEPGIIRRLPKPQTEHILRTG